MENHNVNRGKADAGIPNVANNMDNNNQGQQANEPPQQACRANEIPEQDQQIIPITNVTRIMRRILPPNAKISDDAKEMMQACLTEYIGFVTNEANTRCRMEHRRTVTAEDIIWAMDRLGFDNYVGPLTVYLNRYREFESQRITGNPRRSALSIQPIGVAENSNHPPLLPAANNTERYFRFPPTGSAETGFHSGVIGSSSVELPLFPTDASSSQMPTYDPFVGSSSSQGDLAKFDQFPPYK